MSEPASKKESFDSYMEKWMARDNELDEIAKKVYQVLVENHLSINEVEVVLQYVKCKVGRLQTEAIRMKLL